MQKTTDLVDIGSRFIENIVKSIKNNFEAEIEKYASDYADLVDIGSRFIENIVKSIKNNFEAEIEKYASDYAEAIKKKIKDEAILRLNNLRVEMVQGINRPGLEIRITVVE